MSTTPLFHPRSWQEHKSSLMHRLMTPRPAIAKKGPQVRPLTGSELETAVSSTWLTSCLMNALDELKQTSIYRQDLAQNGNRFLSSLEAHSDEIWTGMQEESKSAAAHSTVMGIELLTRLIKIVYRVNMREDVDREAFAMALETMLNSFGFTLDTVK